MLINFVDATNDANYYTKPPPDGVEWLTDLIFTLGGNCDDYKCSVMLPVCKKVS